MAKSALVKKAIARRLAARRFKRRLQEKRDRAHRRRCGYPALPRGGHLGSFRAGFGGNEPWVHVVAPQYLDLDRHHDETCSFVHQVTKAVQRGHRVCLGFEDVKSVKPAALMYLLGQIHKLRLEFGRHRVTGTYPLSPKVEQLLFHSGFYGLLHVKSRLKTQRRLKSVRYIKFKSDCQINGGEITSLRDDLLGDDLNMPRPIARTVFRALSEAMTNVNHHAYATKAVRAKDLRGRWWLSASLSARNNRFTLTFYDAGVGIPKTLPRRYPMEGIRLALSLLPEILPDDGQMIAAAMALGRSRTGLGNRGKGLLDLAKLIDALGSGKMNIYSRNGMYTYQQTGNAHKNWSGFLEGTLIEWQLPLDKAVEGLSKDFYEEADNDD